MSFPKVAIIILNWNGKKDTLECLNSTRKISYPNYEIILVDNGSCDGSLEAICDLFPEITLIENKYNLGFSCGVNTGIKAAFENKSEYVFLLNNDAIVGQKIIDELVRIARSDHSIGAAVPKVYQYYRKNYLENCGLDITFDPRTHLCWGRGFGELDRGQYTDRQEVEGFSGCGVLLSKRALDKVGVFDPDFFMYGEDVDLSIRLRKGGYKIIFVPEARMWHKGSASAGFKPNVSKSRFLGESVIRCMKKNAGLREWLAFIYKGAAFFPISLAKHTMHGNFRPFMAKSTSALRTLCSIKR